MKAASCDSRFPGSWPRYHFFTNGTWWVADNYSQDGVGSKVWTYPHNGTAAQIWVEELAAEGGVYLHPCYNRWLCMQSGTHGSITRVQNCTGYASQRMEYAYDYPTGFYYILDGVAGYQYALNVRGGVGVRRDVIWWEWVNAANEKWEITGPI